MRAMAAAGPLNLVDTRWLAKPQTFDGGEAAWPAWCFGLESYALLLSKDFARHMDKACDLEEDPYIHEMADSAVELARVLYAILVSVVQNKALIILMKVEKVNASVIGSNSASVTRRPARPRIGRCREIKSRTANR